MSSIQKTVLVTGSSRGIGKAIALRLARDGFAIVVHCRDRRVDADAVAAEIIAAGGAARVLQFDIGERDATASALLADIDTHGCYYGVVANAGVCNWNRFWEMSDEQWETLIDINLTGVWKTLKASVPAIIEGGRGGSIIVVSSVAGLKALPGQAHYASAKFGLVGLTQAAAKELGEYKIRVNSIHPYGVNTPMGVDQGALEVFAKFPQYLPNFTPILSDIAFAEPDEIADTVLWLAGDGSRTVTASHIALDQGNSKV